MDREGDGVLDVVKTAEAEDVEEGVLEGLTLCDELS